MWVVFKPKIGKLCSYLFDASFWASKSRNISEDNLHDFSIAALKHPFIFRLLGDSLQVNDDGLKMKVYGVNFNNLFVLDACLCKNGDTAESLQYLWPGSIVVGSVRKEFNIGNTGRRMKRYDEQRMSGNAMKIPSLGMHYVGNVLRKARINCPLWLNAVGKNADEVLEIFNYLGAYFDLYEINLGCPTDDTASELRNNLGELEKILDERSYEKPVFIKIWPVDIKNFDDRNFLYKIADLAERKINVGLTISNTEPSYDPQIGKLGLGGGRKLFEKNMNAVREIRELGYHFAMKFSGGVHTGYDAAEALEYVDLVGVATELIYGGTRTFQKLNTEFLKSRKLS